MYNELISDKNEMIQKKNNLVCLSEMLIECALLYCGGAIAFFMGHSSKFLQQRS